MALTPEQLKAYIDALAIGGMTPQEYNDVITYILANGDVENAPRDLIQIRRGNFAQLPTLAPGEQAVTLDTEEVFVGGANGNIKVLTAKDLTKNVMWYGAKGDGLNDDTAAIQAAVDDLVVGQTLFFPTGNYKITSAITISKPIQILGEGQFTTYLTCVGCGAFIINKVSAVQIRNIEVATAVRHTTTPNTLIGIDIQGDNTNRPFNIVLSDVYIDGFQVAIKSNYMWSSIFNNVESNFGAYGLRAYGLSVNNVVNNCSFGGSGLAGSRGIQLAGDIPSEGWMIDNTLINNFEIGIQIAQNTHIYINNSILDHCKVYGIVTQASTNFAGNIVVDGCYIGMDGVGGDSGIALTNGISDTQLRGNKITNNTIIVYAGAGCNYGVQCNGANEKYNLIEGNSIQGFALYDVYIALATDTIVKNNMCLSALATNIFKGDYISDNVGKVYYERAKTKQKIGSLTITYDEAVPTTGTWVQGDICYKINPTEVGTTPNKYTVLGWRCVANGTPGTWIEMRTPSGN